MKSEGQKHFYKMKQVPPVLFNYQLQREGCYVSAFEPDGGSYKVEVKGDGGDEVVQKWIGEQ